MHPTPFPFCTKEEEIARKCSFLFYLSMGGWFVKIRILHHGLVRVCTNHSFPYSEMESCGLLRTVGSFQALPTQGEGRGSHEHFRLAIAPSHNKKQCFSDSFCVTVCRMPLHAISHMLFVCNVAF